MRILALLNQRLFLLARPRPCSLLTPRDELPITQPWQTLAYLWLILEVQWSPCWRLAGRW